MSVVPGDVIIWTPDVASVDLCQSHSFSRPKQAGWLVISCHKRGLYKTTEIRLKKEQREKGSAECTYFQNTVN